MLQVLAKDPAAPTTIMVNHHVEEIPPGFTHLLMLRDGVVVTQGPLEQAARLPQRRSRDGAGSSTGCWHLSIAFPARLPPGTWSSAWRWR